MQIDDALIRDIASLAKLELTDEEVARFRTDFEEILAAFDTLDGIDVSDVPSSFRPVAVRNRTRADEPRPGLTREQALGFTDDTEDGYFIGPRTVE